MDFYESESIAYCFWAGASSFGVSSTLQFLPPLFAIQTCALMASHCSPLTSINSFRLSTTHRHSFYAVVSSSLGNSNSRTHQWTGRRSSETGTPSGSGTRGGDRPRAISLDDDHCFQYYSSDLYFPGTSSEYPSYLNTNARQL